MNTESNKFLQAMQFAKERTIQKAWPTPHSDVVIEAVKVWKLDWVKQEGKEIFLKFDKQYVHPEIKDAIVFFKKVIESSCNVDVSDRDQFENLIEIMGLEIFIWLVQAWWKLEKFNKKDYEELLTVYFDNFCWTNTGRIDYEKLISNLSEENKFPSEFTKFFELSTFSFEEKLKQWYRQAKKEVVDSIHKLIKDRCRELKANEAKSGNEYDYYLLAYWHHRLVYGSDRVGIDELIREYGRKFEHPITGAEANENDMMALSASYGHISSLRYFWNRATIDERDQYFVNILTHTFDHENGWNFYGPKIEVSSFLFKSMTVDRRVAFLEAIHRGEVPLIFVAIVLSWPWANFWFPSFDFMKSYIPKARELAPARKEYAFKGLVEFWKYDYAMTHHAQKIKGFVEEILVWSEYNLH